MRVQFKTDYNHDIRLFQDATHLSQYSALILALMVLPFLLSEYYLGELIYVLIHCIAGMGLMLLVGHTGQVSLGHAAFMAIGAYSAINLENLGLPFLIAFPLAGLITGVLGMLMALPMLKMHGIYLAIATMALSIIIEDLVVIAEPITGGVMGMFAETITIFGFEFDRYGNPTRFYYLALGTVLAVTLVYTNLLRSRTGRAFMAIRDSELSARAMGVSVFRYKAIAFFLSCFMTGLAGGLLAHFLGSFNHEAFLIMTSIQLLMMVIIGGLGSIHGAFFGAIVVGFLPALLSIVREQWDSWTNTSLATQLPGLDIALYSLLLLLFILFEPRGIYGRWVKIRTWFELFPLYRKGMFKRYHTYLKTERLK